MEIFSPNNKIKVQLKSSKNLSKEKNQFYFQVYYNNEGKEILVIPKVTLGIATSNESFFDGLQFIEQLPPKVINEKYELIHGKKKYIESIGKEQSFKFKNTSNSIFEIVFRVYDYGIAFRYELPGERLDVIRQTNEFTAFNFGDEIIPKWIMDYDISYENFYEFYENSSISQKSAEDINKDFSYPALFNVKKDLFLLISEANISRFNLASRLKKKGVKEYKIELPNHKSNYNYKDGNHKTGDSWRSPWRVMILGKLQNLVESTLVTDLSAPTAITNTDWIEPGASSWIYWAHNHGTKDFQILKSYVDLAVKMNWPYTLIDWEWDQMSNGGNLENIVKYANERGVKPLMWYNSGTVLIGDGAPTPVDRLVTRDKRAEEFKWLNHIGVYGIKVDFFAGDQQDTMAYYIDLLEEAAEYHLMVNFHGTTIPRGWSRTYPNLMTVEAVYGSEWYNNKPILTKRAAEHNTILPFTRNVIGPMDYTPVTFSSSQHPHTTTYAHELALSVIFESGIQHFADRPEAYLNLPNEIQDFLREVPVAWDDTRFISGYPGKNVVIARKKSENWYVAGINGTDKSQNLNINLSFLDEKAFDLILIKDGEDDKSFDIQYNTRVDKEEFSVEVLPRGGFTAIFSSSSCQTN